MCSFVYMLPVTVFVLQHQSWVVATDLTAAEPAALTAWLFTDKICQPLSYTLQTFLSTVTTSEKTHIHLLTFDVRAGHKYLLFPMSLTFLLYLVLLRWIKPSFPSGRNLYSSEGWWGWRETNKTCRLSYGDTCQKRKSEAKKRGHGDGGGLFK